MTDLAADTHAEIAGNDGLDMLVAAWRHHRRTLTEADVRAAFIADSMEFLTDAVDAGPDGMASIESSVFVLAAAVQRLAGDT